MRLFVVILCVAAAYARPDISLVPSGGYLPGVGGGSLTSGGGFISNGIGGLDNLGGLSGLGGLGGLGNLGGGIALGGGSFSGNNLLGGLAGGNGGLAGNGLIHENKQVHFYSAPEEYQDRLRIYVAPTAQKNSRVIFVKAPTYGALRPEVIAPASVTEDRTKVYVLVKKPEAGGAITIPTSVVSKPTKPEVYFIKYRTEQEAEQALAGGLQEEAAGPSAPELGNAQSFVNSLKVDLLSGGGGGGIGGGIIGGIGGGNVGGIDISGSQLLAGVGGGHLGGATNGLSGVHLGGGSNGISGGHLVGISGVSGSHGPIGASGPYRR